eukprot:TRINITY_DN21867_c0_g1_i2.p1 TRINITY_DN21867_c0_g1~~TRINITY_DN21867_c0_g1_i2.p1  ORF type:complete len:413 (+),score=73.46 TRINITY_DN21867_c0_g1_i2:56-1240(+)
MASIEFDEALLSARTLLFVLAGAIFLVLLARRKGKQASVTESAAMTVSDGAPEADVFADRLVGSSSHVPPGRKIEIAMCPTSGLQWSNPHEVFRFENDMCCGSYFFFHPRTDSGAAAGIGSLEYDSYFKGKTRLWEMRLQLQLKKPLPGSELFFGIQLEQYVKLTASLRRTVALGVAAIRQVIGGVYQSPGDDPDAVQGELEQPCCVLPLWAFDQFIETPPGEEPPALWSPDFPLLGRARKGRVKEYAGEIDDLIARMSPGSVYSFAFWGVSRFVDAVHWKLRGIPLVTPLDFSKLIGQPPVFAVLYALRAGEAAADGKEEVRHLASRKDYLFKAACWSSDQRPDRQRFHSLIGSEHTESSTDAASNSRRKVSLRKKIEKLLNKPFACCTTRPS